MCELLVIKNNVVAVILFILTDCTHSHSKESVIFVVVGGKLQFIAPAIV